MSCLSGSRSAPSGAVSKSEGPPKILEKHPGEFLHHTKLKFSGEQLINLNWRFDEMIKNVESRENDSSWLQVTSTVERLIQRLLCAVGNLDSRFSSKFLVSLNDNTCKDSSLEYLVRLDALSTPVLYPGDPAPSYEIQEFDSEGISPGYARIRLRNKTSTQWAEFINSSGYLRRDKIQERFVELLALAAAGTWPSSPQEVDESFLCASPGKVVDAATLNYILHTKPEEQIYYGSASSSNFPDPRDFRLAIVDSPSGIRIRLGFQVPGRPGDVQVHLLLGVGMDSWPRSAAVPNSGHLTHYQGLVVYNASKTGMYLVAVGSQSSSWQMQFPAARVTLLQHYGPTSPVTLILKILCNILQEIHAKISQDKCKFHKKLLSPIIFEDFLLQALEQPSGPLQAMAEWSTIHLSRKVLQILDNIVQSLRTQHIPGYFFPKENIVGTDFREEEYLVEGNRVYMYLANLHSIQIYNTGIPSHIVLEAQAIFRWSSLVSSLQPAGTTRASRFTRAVTGVVGLSGHYTQNQVEYIAEILEGVLELRQRTLHSLSTSSDVPYPDDPTEDIIYLLVTIISQAREQVFSEASGPSPANSCSRSKSDSRKQKYSTKRRSQFDTAVRKLVDAVRKDKSIKKKNLDDMAVVVCLLRWLHKSLDHSRKTLAPVLRSWLRSLGSVAHDAGTSGRLERARSSAALEEVKTLGIFAKVVCGGRPPAGALIEGVNKGWSWASNILSLVSLSPLRVIFTPSRGKVLRHILSLPSYEQKSSKISKNMEEFLKDRKTATLPSRSNRPVTNFKGGTIPRGHLQSTITLNHQELKKRSPMSETFHQTHRRGKLPCVGDLVYALAAFNKISVLHELSHLLPTEDRKIFLSEVQQLCKTHKRQALRRRDTISVMKVSTSSEEKVSKKVPPRQTYTPTEFVSEGAKKEEKKKEKDSLIGEKDK